MKRFLCSLILTVPMLASAQSNFQKGYLVTNSQDTIRGFIDYKERGENPSSFDFRSAPDAGTKTYTLKECMAYGIDGIEFNERYTLQISKSKKDFESLTVGVDTATRLETVFLRVLQSGKNITLFSYEDPVKRRFFIKEKAMTVPVELIQNFFFTNHTDRVFVTDNKFVRQLAEIAARFNTDIPQRKIGRANYSETDLVRLSYLINGEVPVKAKYRYARFYAGTGLSVSKVTFQGDHPLANKMTKNKSSLMPTLNAGIDMFLNPAIGRFIFRTDIALFYSQNHSINDGQVSDYIYNMSQSFNQFAVTLTPQFIYNVYNTSPLKIFIGAGLGCNFTSYSNNTTSSYNSFRKEITEVKDVFKPEKFNFSFPASAGVVLNKKIELSVMYSLPTAITNYSFYSASMQRWRFGLGYLFGKH